MRTYYKPGTWNTLCAVCGFAHKADELRRRWDGLMVCPSDWESRHPQDLLSVSAEKTGVPWTRTEDLSGYYACSYINIQGLAGTSVAGCAVSGGRGAF